MLNRNREPRMSTSIIEHGALLVDDASPFDINSLMVMLSTRHTGSLEEASKPSETAPLPTLAKEVKS